MKKIVNIIGLYFLLFGNILCEKERIEDENLEQISKQLLHEIEKRLQQYDTHADNSDQCLNAKNITNTIIKTQESLDSGAVFLDSPDTKSAADCTKQCCGNKDCNLAVFKNKDGETSCYMFDCGNPSVCEFVDHEGFTLISLPNRKTTKTGVAHEDDLERLAAPTSTTTTTKATTTIPTTTTTPATTTTTTPVTTTQPTTTPQRKHHVTLYGECTEDEQCSDSYAVCLAGFCMCDKGYSYQESVCRPDCTKFQFKCANERQPLAYPQCIAIYDKCDGIIHCKDGSDEVGCSTDSSDKDSGSDDSAIYQGTANRKSGGHSQQQQQLGSDYHMQLKNLNPNSNRQSNYYDVGQGMSYYDPDYRSHGSDKQSQQPSGSNPYSNNNNNNNYGGQDSNNNNYQNSMMHGVQNNVEQPPARSRPVATNTASDMINNNQQQNRQPNHIEDQPLQRQRPYPLKQQPSQPQKVNSNPPSRPVNNSPNKPPIFKKPKQEIVDQQNSYNQRPHQVQRKPGVENEHANRGQQSSGSNQKSNRIDPSLVNHEMPSSSNGKAENNHRGFNQEASDSKQPNYGGSRQSNSQDQQYVGHSEKVNKKPESHRKTHQKAILVDGNSDESDRNQMYNPYKVWSGDSEDSQKIPPRPSPTYELPGKPTKVEPKLRPSSNDNYKSYGDSSKNMGDGYQPSNHGGYLTEGGYVKDNNNKQRQNTWQDLRNNERNSVLTGGSSSKLGSGGNGYNSWNRGNYWNSPSSSSYQYYDTGNDWPSRGYYPKPQVQQPHYDYYNAEPGYPGYNPYSIGNSLKSLWSQKKPSGSGYWNSGANSGASDQENKNSDETDNQVPVHPTVSQNKPTVPTEKLASKLIPKLTAKTTEKVPDQKPTSNTHTVKDDNKSSADETNKAVGTKADDESQTSEEDNGSKSVPDSSAKESKSDIPSTKNKTEKGAAKSSDETQETENSDNSKEKEQNEDTISEVKVNKQQEEEVNESYVIEEKLVIQSNKGAVVALALGLVITFLLLVFVGCRLRNVRKRLRHGRPMNSNEADYLINGMYL